MFPVTHPKANKLQIQPKENKISIVLIYVRISHLYSLQLRSISLPFNTRTSHLSPLEMHTTSMHVADRKEKKKVAVKKAVVNREEKSNLDSITATIKSWTLQRRSWTNQRENSAKEDDALYVHTA